MTKLVSSRDYSMHRTILPFLLLIAAEASAQSPKLADVTALHKSGMHEQAAAAAEVLLQQSGLAAHDRADLAIELAIIYTEQAASAAPNSRAALWTKAEQACSTVIEGYPENPRLRLVEVQRALVLIARGEKERQTSEPDAALQHLRAATRQLASISAAIGSELIERRLRAQRGESRDELTVEELESLELHVAFHLARAERQTGLCYPAGSPDRDDLILQSVKRLMPLIRQEPPDELIWKARVLLVACQRELGNPRTAQQLVDAWTKADPPTEIAQQFAAILASPAPQPVARQTPGQSESPSRSESLTESASREDLREAAAARANGQFTTAAEHYRRFALAEPDNPQAADAHRLATLCTADQLRQTPPDQQPELAQAYETLLEEHLRIWPAQETSDDVRMWYGRLLASRRDWPTSVAAFQQVRPQSEFYSESLKLVADGYDHQLQQLAGDTEQAGNQRKLLLTAATEYLQPIITGPANRWPATWNDAQRAAALALARLHVRYADPSSPYATQLLTAALQGASHPMPDAIDNWQTAARLTLVSAFVRNQRVAEARALFAQQKSAPADLLFETLTTIIAEIPLVSSTAARKELGELALSLVQRLDAISGKLDEKSLAQLNVGRAAALAATGDRSAALTQYGALAAQYPDDADVQEQYSALLAESDVPADLRKALTQWQAVEVRSRRGGDRWRRARAARIKLLSRLGESVQAEKLTRLTRLLYPDWNANTQPK